MILRTCAVIFGIFFAALGVLGFYPEITGGKIFGVFTAGKLDNLAHLIIGITAAFCGIQSSFASKMMFVIVGVLAGAFALYGFLQGPGLYFGLRIGGLPDLWLLTTVSVVSLYLGLFLRSGK